MVTSFIATDHVDSAFRSCSLQQHIICSDTVVNKEGEETILWLPGIRQQLQKSITFTQTHLFIYGPYTKPYSYNFDEFSL